MAKKSFFIESTYESFENITCDKCGLRVKDIQDGVHFWNPNKRAHHKVICRNCYDVWKHEKEENYRVWREKHAELKVAKKANDSAKS